MVTNFTRRSLYVLFLGLSIGLFGFNHQASASPIDDYNNWSGGNALPTEASQYINLTEKGASGNFANTGDVYGFESSSAAIKVYSKNAENKGVSMQFVDRGVGVDKACSNYTIQVIHQRLQEHADGSVTRPAVNGSSRVGMQMFSISPAGGDCNVYKNIVIPSDAFVVSDKQEHRGLYTALVTIQIFTSGCAAGANDGNCPKTPSFRLQMDPGIPNSGADAKLAFAGTEDTGDSTYTVDGSTYEFTPDKAFNNGVSIYPSRLSRSNTVHYSFAPPCALAGGRTFFVDWLGLDPNSPAQTQYRVPYTNTVEPSGNNINLRVTRANGTTTGISSDGVVNTGSASISNGPRGTSYVFRITELTGGNGVRVVLPFDSGSGKFSCPPVEKPIQCTQFRHDLPNVSEGSIYRYSVFYTNNEYLNSSSPAAGAVSPTYTAWYRSYTEAPKQQVTINTNDYNDGQADVAFNYPDDARFSSQRKVYIERWRHTDTNGNGTKEWQYSITSQLVSNCPTDEVPPPPKNWWLLPYTWGPSYVELGSSANFRHELGNAGPDVASGYGGGLESNYDLTNPASGIGGWRNNGFLPDPVSPGNTLAYNSPTYVGTGTEWLGRNYCQRYFVDPRQMVNDNFTGGRAESNGTAGSANGAACAIVVGGKTSIGLSANKTEIEPEETVTFQIDLGTNYFTAGGGWSGYQAVCVYELFVNGVMRDRSFSCTRNIGANGTQSTAISATGVSVGDQICLNTSLDVPSNRAFLASGDNSRQQCVRVVARPYFKVFAGDISAGNGFCGTSTTNASVIGWNTNDGATAYRGSGVQYAIYAQGIIKGVAPSRYLPDNANFGGGDPKKLAFANTGMSLNGGEFGGSIQAGSCITDYFSGKPDTVNPWFDIGNSNNSSYGVERAFEANTSTILRGVSENSANYFQLGNNTKLYVNGDVYINSDITAQLGAQSVDQIPNFMLIAKGNIYIDKSVRNLFGTYVAQPNGNSKGEIYTCSSENAGNFTPVSTAQAYNECRTQLKVTGAFVARKINLQRTLGSLYMDRDGNAVSGSGQANAAEIFQYNPLTWLRQSTSSTTTGNDVYDAMNISRPTL